MKILCVRHLPTAFNQEGLLQGMIDNPILEPSRRDYKKVKQNRKLLGLRKFNIVIASQLLRTQETAIIHGYQEFFVEPLSNELNFGNFEGRHKEELINGYSYEWFNDVSRIPLGESFVEFNSRITRFIDVYRKHEQLLLFGHGAFIRALYALSTLGEINKMNQIEIKNNQILEVDFYG